PLDRIASRIGMDPIPKLGPVADVGPVESGGNEQQPVGLLHHAPVYDLDRQPAIELGRGGLVAGMPSRHDLAQACQVARRLPGRLVDEDVQAPRKPRQVPEIATLAHELPGVRDRKSTRLNSSHEWISYAVFRLKKNTWADEGRASCPAPSRLRVIIAQLRPP